MSIYQRLGAVGLAAAIWLAAPTAFAEAQTEPAAPAPGAQQQPLRDTGEDASSATPSSRDEAEGQADSEGGAAAGMRFDPSVGRYVPAGEQLPWRNSVFIFMQLLSANTLDKDAQLTYNPIYLHFFSLQPRWYLTDSLSLRLRQDFYVELTDPEVYTERTYFYDTRIEVVESELVEIAGFIFGGGGRLLLPLSIKSRAHGRIIGTAVIGTVTKSFDNVLSGLVLKLPAWYAHYFSASNLVEAEAEIGCTPAVSAPEPASFASSDCLGGISNETDEFLAGLAAKLMLIPDLDVSGSLTWIWRRAAGLQDAVVPTATGEVVVPDSSPTHWRNYTEAGLSLGYLFDEWLHMAFGLYASTSQLAPDGSRRNPFFNVDTHVMLTATVTLDQLYLAVARN